MAVVNGNMADASTLLSSLSTDLHQFLQPSSSLHQQTLYSVKTLLDPLAVKVADAQRTRRDESRRKRKRGDTEAEEVPLQLRQIYTDGLAIRQVWEQARRILDAAADEVSRAVITHEAERGPVNVEESDPISVDEDESEEADDDMLEIGSDEEDDLDDLDGEEEEDQEDEDEDEEADEIEDSEDQHSSPKVKKSKKSSLELTPKIPTTSMMDSSPSMTSTNKPSF